MKYLFVNYVNLYFFGDNDSITGSIRRMSGERLFVGVGRMFCIYDGYTHGELMHVTNDRQVQNLIELSNTHFVRLCVSSQS